jgi:tetratricopeptide (TPR) repeat protein
MSQLKSQAIQTALTGDWDNAILLNHSLLEENPHDIDTLNRLAFAYASTGNTKQAKELYQKVLQLDTQNPIALRNLKRLGSNGTNHGKMPVIGTTHVSNLFIEEPGKTKVIELLNVADKKVIAPLRSGESVTLSIKRMKIFILDQNKQYLGMLPDDIGRRLIGFINGGNEYEAYIKSVDNNKVTIFARETKRTSRFKDQPSFIYSDRSKLTLSHGHGKHKAAKHVDHEEDNDEEESTNDSEE